ncbi:hypothetical protein [Chamaesiphon sp.]|uniref:hypothetical protein n=1 Tax=Chamaesiphon sp. TaxID=2814140 RepID=UPI0035933B28
MTLFTPIRSAEVIYLLQAMFLDRANSDTFDAADASSRSASGGAGDDTFSLYTFTEKIQIFNQII